MFVVVLYFGGVVVCVCEVGCVSVSEVYCSSIAVASIARRVVVGGRE